MNFCKINKNIVPNLGSSLQVLVSPILAGLAVGIGVPILLFYVYGVVPVSLCRSGGCGVSTNGTGVRFDFDDENELMGSLSVRNGGGKYIIQIDFKSVRLNEKKERKI